MKKQIRIVAILLFWLGFSVAHAKLTIQIEPKKVQEGQTIRLTLAMNEVQNRIEPDLSPIQHDFTIVGTQRTVNYSVINGHAQSLNQWIVILLPKRTGVITIPPIKVGQETTQLSKIEVVKDQVMTDADPLNENDLSQQEKIDQTPPVKLRTEVSISAPLVNQQVIYTVKLYNSRRLMDADYQPPQVKDALMIALGSPNRSQEMMHGVPYIVESMQYAIFPQKSGPLKIKPPRFSALLFDTVPGKIEIHGKPTTLQVKPIPVVDPQQKSHWLPAKKVSLSERYDKQSTDIEQGGMLVRTIRLKAIGVPAQLLPSLPIGKGRQFSLYPAKPQEETTYENGNLVGISSIKVSYLMNQTGTIVIPAVKLPWFNTETGHAEVAILPARTLMVSPTINKTALNKAPLKAPQAQSVTTGKALPSVSWSFGQSRWAWSFALGFAGLWLLTLLAWWWTRRTTPQTPSLKQLRRHVRQACMNHDPIAAKNALMAWAKKIAPNEPLLNLTDVTNQIEEPLLQQAIDELAQQLYQPSKAVWDGKKFWLYFAQYKPFLNQSKSKKRTSVTLPPLNLI